MAVRITKRLPVNEDGQHKTYFPGDVVTRSRTCEIALDGGFGVEIDAAGNALVKASPAPKNKAQGAAPKNKS